MLFNLHLANNTVLLSFFFFFFLIIYLYLLIPAAIAQLFNPIDELVIPVEVPNKEAKAEIEIHQILAEAKIRKSSI